MIKSAFKTLILLSIALSIAMFPVADAQSGIDAIYTEPGSTGFKTIATQSIVIATATPTIIGVMPYGCREITVVASGARMYYGDEHVDTTGLYPYIEDGDRHVFNDNSTRKPSIYFRALSTATAKIGIQAR